jgi:hypothetical protein
VLGVTFLWQLELVGWWHLMLELQCLLTLSYGNGVSAQNVIDIQLK